MITPLCSEAEKENDEQKFSESWPYETLRDVFCQHCYRLFESPNTLSLISRRCQYKDAVLCWNAQINQHASQPERVSERPLSSSVESLLLNFDFLLLLLRAELASPSSMQNTTVTTMLSFENISQLILFCNDNQMHHTGETIIFVITGCYFTALNLTSSFKVTMKNFWRWTANFHHPCGE